jgi:FimV-like protein
VNPESIEPTADWQQRIRAVLPDQFDHPFSPYAILILVVALISWVLIRLVFGGPRRRPAQTASSKRAPLRQDPMLEPSLGAESAAPESLLTSELPPSPAIASPSTVIRPSTVPLSTSPSPAHADQSDLERAIGGRFDLPSLDLGGPSDATSSTGTGSQDVQHPTLRPTPRGTRQSDGSPSKRDPESLLAVSSGLAAVVRQQVNARLELAAAYMDLGDEPRARQLLAQTLIDGDEAQRSTAQRLLNQLVRTE